MTTSKVQTFSGHFSRSKVQSACAYAPSAGMTMPVSQILLLLIVTIHVAIHVHSYIVKLKQSFVLGHRVQRYCMYELQPQLFTYGQPFELW